MRLIEPNERYSEQIADFRQEFLDAESSMDGQGPLRRMPDPAQWLQFCRENRTEETCDPRLVPATQFLYVRESDNRIVGMIQVRHRFNAFLERYAGHIGYSVRPSERRKGYAKSMLQAVLPYCASLGLSRILVSCLKGNIASAKTILANGGVYESTVFYPEHDAYLERYWIELPPAESENKT